MLDFYRLEMCWNVLSVLTKAQRQMNDHGFQPVGTSCS